MSCRVTAVGVQDLKHADASNKESVAKIAAPNSDTNMHRASAAQQKSADESEIKGGKQKSRHVDS